MTSRIPQGFSLNYTGISNRIISDVEITKYFDPNNPSIKPTLLKTTALWDTGATSSIVTLKTAQDLGLVPIGRTTVNHGDGQSEHSTHLVNFLLPNRVLIVGIVATEMENIVDNFGAIVGMDIISQGDFSLTHFGGNTCFSFRIPSLKKIDYVEEWNSAIQGLRGHDKCPCKSGKQVRKCHPQFLT